MSTREIPREHWLAFFDDFNRTHEGWMVAVEESGPDMGVQEEAVLPLVGIAADLKDGENAIVLMLGGRPGQEKNRIITGPEHVWFRHESEDAHDALEIETREGEKTILRFQYVSADDPEHQLHMKL